jgi:uncharacterized protein (DUF2267 family)
MANTKITVFDSTLEKSHAWIGELTESLGIASKREAYRALRSVLHALRDQLDATENAELAAQFPMLLRGLYFEGWRPGRQRHVRSREEFLAIVLANHDIRPQCPPEDMVRAVATVLAMHVEGPELAQVYGRLAEPVRELFLTAANV